MLCSGTGFKEVRNGNGGVYAPGTVCTFRSILEDTMPYWEAKVYDFPPKVCNFSGSVFVEDLFPGKNSMCLKLK